MFDEELPFDGFIIIWKTGREKEIKVVSNLTAINRVKL